MYRKFCDNQLLLVTKMYFQSKILSLLYERQTSFTNLAVKLKCAMNCRWICWTKFDELLEWWTCTYIKNLLFDKVVSSIHLSKANTVTIKQSCEMNKWFCEVKCEVAAVVSKIKINYRTQTYEYSIFWRVMQFKNSLK